MVELQTTWSWQPAIYLFLGGLGAGAFLTVALLRLLKPGKFEKTIFCGVWTATAALAIGLLALVSEVEKPLQAMLMYKSFINGSSWMTVGAWLLLVTFIVFALSAVLSTDKLVDWLGSVIKPLKKIAPTANKVLAILGIPCAVALAAYTGILLGAAPAVPMWNSDLLPVLFTLSAFDAGVSAVAIYAVVLEKDEGIEKVRFALEVVVAILIVLEAIVLFMFVSAMQTAGTTEALSVSLLTDGALSMQFWGLVVAVGLVVPLVTALAQIIAAKSKGGSHLPMAVSVGGSVCALLGSFTLRFVILSAGLHAALISPDVLQAAQGISFIVA